MGYLQIPEVWLYPASPPGIGLRSQLQVLIHFHIQWGKGVNHNAFFVDLTGEVGFLQLHKPEATKKKIIPILTWSELDSSDTSPLDLRTRLTYRLESTRKFQGRRAQWYLYIYINLYFFVIALLVIVIQSFSLGSLPQETDHVKSLYTDLELTWEDYRCTRYVREPRMADVYL